MPSPENNVIVSITKLLRYQMELGTTSEGFPKYNKLGSVRHECDLQWVMTSCVVHGLRCADVHECTCINHEMTRKTVGRTTEELTEKHKKSLSGHVSIRNEN